jgi:N-carbamoylputrescine amidase
MKLAMAQISMSDDMKQNLSKTLSYMEQAKNCDLIFFPEIQLSPFFPQYEKQNVQEYLLNLQSDEVVQICEKSRECGLYTSPNIYLLQNGKPYDTSLWINPQGEIEGISKMVHIMQAEQFYECDYYTPSNDGFHVYNTPFGKVGIVICFDRHLPESIRTCVVMGAKLIIVPTANTKSEPNEMFECEMRVQAFQNNVFIAMCNRVGVEDDMEFCGNSIVIDPNGDVIFKADDTEQLITAEIDLNEADISRQKRPYIKTRRAECYL